MDKEKPHHFKPSFRDGEVCQKCGGKYEAQIHNHEAVVAAHIAALEATQSTERDAREKAIEQAACQADSYGVTEVAAAIRALKEPAP